MASPSRMAKMNQPRSLAQAESGRKTRISPFEVTNMKPLPGSPTTMPAAIRAQTPIASAQIRPRDHEL